MSPQIRNESRLSLVGTRFIVPVSPWRPNEFPYFNSCFLYVFAPPSAQLKRSHIILRGSALECGSPVAAFSINAHDSMFAKLNKLCQPASAASVSASTSTPRAISSGDAYSSGRWLNPFRQGIKSIPTGATRDIKRES